MYQRRTVLGGVIGVGAAAAVRASPSRRPALAVTVDDFGLADTPLLTGAERDARIRSILARHRIKAAGFVAGKYVKGPVADEVLGAWSREGHVIGNHSFSHGYYGAGDPDAYMADILKCEALLSPYPGFRKLFRYPFLAEGKTAEARDALRPRLHAAGYSNGHVTIDTSDWAIDGRLRKRLAADPKADLAPYRKFYLQHLWERANFYDGLAQKLFGGSIEHTILLHHRLTTALFLGDALDMFRSRGWRLIDARESFANPVFRLQPKSLPSGQSLVWAVAKERGGYESISAIPARTARPKTQKWTLSGSETPSLSLVPLYRAPRGSSLRCSAYRVTRLAALQWRPGGAPMPPGHTARRSARSPHPKLALLLVPMSLF